MSNKLQSRLRAVVVGATNFATVLTMSGVVYLAPVASAQTVTVMNGDVVKTADNPDVFIMSMVGAKKFKRLILNPAIFESYGHLSWGAIKTVSKATLDMYTTSTLVIEVNADGSVYDPKVYAIVSPANSDMGTKHWMDVTAMQFEAGGLDWDSIAKINHTEAAVTFYPAGTAVMSSDNLMTWGTNVSGGSTSTTTAATELLYRTGHLSLLLKEAKSAIARTCMADTTCGSLPMIMFPVRCLASRTSPSMMLNLRSHA